MLTSKHVRDGSSDVKNTCDLIRILRLFPAQSSVNQVQPYESANVAPNQPNQLPTDMKNDQFVPIIVKGMEVCPNVVYSLVISNTDSDK